VDLRDLSVRGIATRRALVGALVAVGVAPAACDATPPAPDDAAQVAYLRDAASRRRALAASLVNPDNRYSALRLARYASGGADDWDRLPAWNPRVAVVSAASLDGPAAPPTALPADARALDLPDQATFEPSRSTSASLVALGEEAFFRYPAQLAPASLPSPSRLLAERYGLWIDEARGVGGLVRVEVEGGAALAYSCATCHADVVGGRLVAGLPSARFDLGLLLADGTADAARAASLLAWGPGRVDVTTEDATLPERISDLRPTRWLTHLQYDATVRQADVVALAIRIETLLITSHGQALRPPRLVALALAQYLWSLSAALPEPRAADARGGALFQATCAGCHAGSGFTGAPRALDEIGTDATLGLSPDRGTGTYRVSSLRGAAARPTLLHDGTLTGVGALLDPARLTASYAGGARGAGAVPGHAFGLDLSSDERAALVSYLEGL
jgi:cytochrome c5